MSASLVGSEMCIRDSPPTWLPGRAAWPEPWEPSLSWLSWPSRATTSGSVSYTHLTLPTICSV
eukprot:1851727-Alexandrium_andersonii.AAC.1